MLFFFSIHCIRNNTNLSSRYALWSAVLLHEQALSVHWVEGIKIRISPKSAKSQYSKEKKRKFCGVREQSADELTSEG